MDYKQVEKAFSSAGKSRIKPKVEAMLNERIAKEAEAAYIYKNMSVWCNVMGLFGAYKMFGEHYYEELDHMNKIYSYMLDRGSMPKNPNIKAINEKYKDLKDVISKALEHEISVTIGYEKACDIAYKEGDKVTAEFLRWYLNEQIEEESKFADILSRLEYIGNDKAAEIIVDKELSK